MPPPASAETVRNLRRLMAVLMLLIAVSPLFGCRGFDGRFDASVSATTADIAVHGIGNVRIARIAISRQQGDGTHDLAGLAVAALCHVVFQPGSLYRVITLLTQT